MAKPWIRKYRPDGVAPNGIGVREGKFIAQPSFPGFVSPPYTEDWGIPSDSQDYIVTNIDGIPYYNLKGNNSGYSPSGTKGKSKIDGKPLSNMNTLPNCVGLAWGIYNETYVRNMQAMGEVISDGFYYHVSGNGEHIVDNMASALKTFEKKGLPLPRIIKPGTAEYEEEPPLGGLISWGGTSTKSDGTTVYYNHVAYICKVVDKNTIYIVQSGYNGSVGPWNIYKCVRSKEWAYAWSNKPSGIKCNGFVSNPAIDLLILNGSPPSVSNIMQKNPTTITAHCSTGYTSNSISYLDVFYKWDSDTVSTKDYDGTTRLTSSGDISIEKPREASTIAIIIVQVDSKGNSTQSVLTAMSLSSSLPTSSIYVDGQIMSATPQIWIDGGWKQVVPCIYTNGKWNELYTTGTEKVN